MIEGTTIGHIKGDAGSLDYSIAHIYPYNGTYIHPPTPPEAPVGILESQVPIG